MMKIITPFDFLLVTISVTRHYVNSMLCKILMLIFWGYSISPTLSLLTLVFPFFICPEWFYPQYFKVQPKYHSQPKVEEKAVRDIFVAPSAVNFQ